MDDPRVPSNKNALVFCIAYVQAALVKKNRRMKPLLLMQLVSVARVFTLLVLIFRRAACGTITCFDLLVRGFARSMVCLFVYWFVGLLVCLFVGVLVFLVCWFVGLLLCWTGGLLVCFCSLSDTTRTVY